MKLWKNLRKTVAKGFNGLYVFLMTALVFLSALLFNASRWLIETWGLLTIDEIIFHLKVPLEGTNGDMVWEFVERCVPEAIILVLAVLVCFIGIWKHRLTRYIYGVILMVICVFGIKNALNYVWVNLDVETYLEEQKTQSKFIEENYVDPRSVQITFPEQKRNLIYIFMESMESTYASTEVGGAYMENYIPELTQMAEANVNFSTPGNIGGADVTTGATWTMGAMFAHTTGMPLIIPVGGNEMDTQDTFFSEIETLGDILNEAGYYQELMIGSDATFGGRRNYFTIHGEYDIFDYNSAKEEGKIPEDYSVWWGYEDAKLFEFAKERLTEMAASSQPFNFTMLTADTHFEDGYLCQLCQDQFGDQYANVMACASRQIYDFVSWIQQQPFALNTTIVLVGDHLTMDKDFCEDVPADYQRKIYEVFINPLQTAETDVERQFSELDLFPTTLASLGVQIEGNRIGLGTNLFSLETPTLVETYGLDYINSELKKKSSFYENFIKDITVDSNKDEEFVD